MGNFFIVTIPTLNKKLQNPIYFFRKLFLLDMCSISVTVPKAYIIILLKDRVISMFGYAAQIFLMILCALVEMLFLTVMIYDCYVGICHAFQYPMMMSPQICIQMTLASVLQSLESMLETHLAILLSIHHGSLVLL